MTLFKTIEPIPQRRSTAPRVQDPFAAFVTDLHALGVDRMHGGGLNYGLLGAAGNARWWLIPTQDRKAASASLAMLQATTPRARVAKAGARALLRCGLTEAFLPRRINLSAIPSRLYRIEPRLSTVSYFTGTAGPHRKTAVQMMDADAQILGYAKLSRNPLVRPFLANEASILGQIANLSLRHVDHPRVLRHSDLGAASLLVTDSVKAPGFQTAPALGPLHRAFLAELAQATGRIGAQSILDDLTAELAHIISDLPMNWRRRFTQSIAALRPAVGEIPVNLAHGDFTPWNCFIQNARLYVFDWEYAQQAYPKGYDFIHFQLATAPPVHIENTLDRLLFSLAQDLFDGDVILAQNACLLSLLLHSTFYIARSLDAGGTGVDWENCGFRGDLIDAVLARVQAGHGPR